MKLYLQSLNDNARKFEVIAYNPETKRGTIKSLRYGATFPEDLSKERLTQLGYRIEKVTEE